MFIFGSDSALDKFEHYAICPVSWRFFSAPIPCGLGIDAELRSVDTFLCVRSGMFVMDKISSAIAVHVATKAVTYVRYGVVDAATADMCTILRLEASAVGFPRCLRM